MLVATTIRESDELLETQPSQEGDGSKNATHEKDVFSDGKAPIAGSEEVRKEVIPPEFALVLHCFFLSINPRLKIASSCILVDTFSFHH